MDWNWTLALAACGVGVVVGLTGMGGGALMTPVLVLMFGVNPGTAVSADVVTSLVLKPFGGSVHVRRRTVNWRLVRSVLVAPTDEEARKRAFSPEGSQRHFFNHFFKVFSKIRQLDPVRPRPGVADGDITVDDIIESRLIYGSPQTVAAKLAALRKSIGPFGTLLISGMDWSGPNKDWERESLTLLAQDVLPLLRKQISIDEAAPV